MQEMVSTAVPEQMPAPVAVATQAPAVLQRPLSPRRPPHRRRCWTLCSSLQRSVSSQVAGSWSGAVYGVRL